MIRLHADGYIVAEKVLSSQSECLSPAALVVETISLKELGEKTSTDMLEVRLYVCLNSNKHYLTVKYMKCIKILILIRISNYAKKFLCVVKITDVEEIANWWTYSDYDNESLQLDGKIKYVTYPSLIKVVAWEYPILFNNCILVVKSLVVTIIMNNE